MELNKDVFQNMFLVCFILHQRKCYKQLLDARLFSV